MTVVSQGPQGMLMMRTQDITDATASLLGAIERGNDGLKELHEALHASNTIAEIVSFFPCNWNTFV